MDALPLVGASGFVLVILLVLLRLPVAIAMGCVGYVERCNPAIIAMRERIQQGVLGEIYQITTSRQGPFPPSPNRSAAS